MTKEFGKNQEVTNEGLKQYIVIQYTFAEFTAAKISDIEFPGVNFLECERLRVLPLVGLILDCLLDVLLRDIDLPRCDSCLFS